MNNVDTTKDVTVSVIIATYHRDKDLYNALLSLTKQNYTNMDVIVVDDNADKEWNKRVEANIEKIRSENNLIINYIQNETNLGSAATRNRGIDAAKGEYITFLDDDDVYLPQKIEMQLKDIIAADADYGLTDLYLYNEKDEIIDKRTRHYIKSTNVNDMMRYHLLYHMTGTDTLMFKKEYLKKIGGFPGIDVGDEFYLMKEAILGGGKCAYSPHCYVKAYVHTGEAMGLSSGQGKIDGENALHEEKKKYFDFLRKKDIRYLKMRHFAVLAFAEVRRKGFIKFISYSVQAFFNAPIEFFKLIFNFKR